MLIFIVSLLAGIIGGMGIGGGTILIPALTIFLHTEQHIAQSVNLLSFVPAASVAVISHLRQRNIERGVTLKIILGGILGALVGSYLAILLPASILRRLFGIFLFVMGLYEILCRSNKKKV